MRILTTIMALMVLLPFARNSFSESITYPSSISLEATSLTANGFLYPAITHSEESVISNDVLFFYSVDALAHFGGDHERMLAFLDGSIALNNESFRRQDIPLRRNISGVIPFPEIPGVVDDSADHLAKLTSVQNSYYFPDWKYDSIYNASYISGLLRHYPNNGSVIGQGRISGRFSWVTSGSGTSPTSTITHELGHNDGLVHNESESETYRDNIMSPYSVGANCGSDFQSVMQSGSRSRTEAFFSSPLVTNADGIECGINNISDVARAYKEAISDNLPATGAFPFADNKPTPTKTGTVGISVLSTIVESGNNIDVELLWEGASLGDTVQILVERNNASIQDVASTMESFTYTGQSVVAYSIPTIFNEEPSANRTVNITLVYPHKINIGVTNIEVTITSEQIIYPGKFSLSSNTANVVEGNTVSLTINRTGGAEGSAEIVFTTSDGTATSRIDYTEIVNSVFFEDGETQREFTLNAFSDNIAEPIESYFVTLTAEDNLLGEVTRAEIFISDPANEPQPQAGAFSLSADVLSVTEGETTSLSILRRKGTAGEISVNIKSTFSSALANDFTNIDETIVFADGDTVKTIIINTIQDNEFEGDETFIITLSSEAGNLEGIVKTEIIIVDDEVNESKGIFNLSTSSSTVNEGASINVTVQRTGGANGEVTININTQDGTAMGADYSALNETVTFKQGETTKTFSLNANADPIREQTETFSINITSEESVLGQNTSTTISIIDQTSPIKPTADKSSGGSINLSFFSLLLIIFLRRNTSQKSTK